MTSRRAATSRSRPRTSVIRRRAIRRSDSSCDSPGPRVPMPPPSRSRCFHMPRMRCRLYSSCASSTWSLPCAVWACWAKISRITAVRSTTRDCSASSSRRCWRGVSSSSITTTSAPACSVSRFSSSSLPGPRYVEGCGPSRCCTTVATVSTCAVRSSSSISSSSSRPSSPCGRLATITPRSGAFCSAWLSDGRILAVYVLHRDAQMLLDPADRLPQALVGQCQRKADIAFAVRPVRGPGRHHHSRLLEHQLGERHRGVPVGHRHPDVHRPLRRRHLDADSREGLHEQVAPPAVDVAHLARERLALGEGADGRHLDCVEHPRVDVRLQLPELRDHVGVAHGGTDTPARHVPGLREREHLDARLLRARGLQEAGSDVSV